MSTITQSIHYLPQFEGPIPVSESSHPFSAMAYAREPLDLDAYGYMEEEFFQLGFSQVYTENGETPQIVHEDLPYKTRVMIRKPKRLENFNGRVYLDIYNASNGYDIEDIWRRSYQYYMETGAVYIGITSKPINVLSLKHFDYTRYVSLNWSGAESAPQPATINPNMSIPGCEEGLFWDMLSQLGHAIKTNQTPFLAGYDVSNVYLTGQSQSAMYLNTYVYYFDPYLKTANKQPIFSGYLSTVGFGLMRSLKQDADEKAMFSVRPQKFKQTDVPIIFVSSEGDVELFASMPQNLDAIDGYESCARHYEVVASPHTDPSSPLIPDNAEIVKCKQPPKILDGEYDYQVNDIQLAYYINTALEWLRLWAEEGKSPATSQLFTRDDEQRVCYDEEGIVKGGMRHAYIDVPIAHYDANATPGDVNGKMTYFTKEELSAHYKDQADYLTKVNHAIDEEVIRGQLLSSDAERMKHWAKHVAQKLWQDS